MIVCQLTPAQVGKALTATDRAIRKAQQGAVLEAAAVGAEILSRAAPVDTGRLKQSFRLRRKGASGHPEIVADAPYAGVMEAGARPHWAPLRPLVAWVRRHAGLFNLTARAPKRARRTGRFQANPGIVSIARAIQRKIAREGTKPRWFVKKSLPRLGQILATLLREAKSKALANIQGGP